METTVNGMKMEVYVSKKWGAINLGGQLLILPQYPLQELQQIDFGGTANAEPNQS